MNVLVDTSVWSLALRRAEKTDKEIVQFLTALIKDSKVEIIGPIRQELLSGIKSDKQFKELKTYLSAFPDIYLDAGDYEKAAEFFNICRKNGIQGSNTDFLICAVAWRYDLGIFTLDNDFSDFTKCLPVKLYSFTVLH